MNHPIVPNLSDTETETLRLAQEFRLLESNPAWLRIRQFMQGAVDDAAERLNGYLGGDSRVAHGLLKRYQERRAMLELVDGYIESVKQARADTLRDIAIGMGISPEKAVNTFSFDHE